MYSEEMKYRGNDSFIWESLTTLDFFTNYGKNIFNGTQLYTVEYYSRSILQYRLHDDQSYSFMSMMMIMMSHA